MAYRSPVAAYANPSPSSVPDQVSEIICEMRPAAGLPKEPQSGSEFAGTVLGSFGAGFRKRSICVSEDPIGGSRCARVIFSAPRLPSGSSWGFF